MNKVIIKDKRMDGCGECIYTNNPIECKKCTLPVGYHYEEEGIDDIDNNVQV